MIKNKMSLKDLLHEQPKEIEYIILSYYDDLVIEDYRLEHKTKMKLVLFDWYCQERGWYHYPCALVIRNRPSPLVMPECLGPLPWGMEKHSIDAYRNLGLVYCPSNICLDYLPDEVLIDFLYWYADPHNWRILRREIKEKVKTERRRVIHLILELMNRRFGYGNVYFSDEHPLPINI